MIFLFFFVPKINVMTLSVTISLSRVHCLWSKDVKFG